MVKLIFLHLPKTGGSSILQTLNQIYGLKKVRHFERDECLILTQNNRRIAQVIEQEVEVLHGHFLYEEIKDIVKKDKPKLVTFMRQPIERVVSNFNWFKYTLAQNPNHPEQGRSLEPLAIYAQRPETSNKMTRFLKGSRLKHYYFIGFLEHFETSCLALARALNWPKTPVFHKKNKQHLPLHFNTPNAATIKIIERNNKKDLRLYHKALAKFGV